MKYRVGMRVMWICTSQRGRIGQTGVVFEIVGDDEVWIKWNNFKREIGVSSWGTVQDRDSQVRVLDEEVEEQQL